MSPQTLDDLMSAHGAVLPPLVPGNIDLSNRPRVPNPDGSISTVRSLSFNENGKEILIPTVVGNRVVSDDDAIAHYHKTGQHLGMFKTSEQATAFAQQLHESEAQKLTADPLDALMAQHGATAEPTVEPDFKTTNVPWNAPGGDVLLDNARTFIVDPLIGALKGAGNTIFGLGKAVHDYTPIGRISDAIQPGAFAQKPPELVPQGGAQKIGYGAEQIGEFFLPTGEAGAIARYANPAQAKRILQGAEAAKAGVTTLAQTGSPTAAVVSAGLGAVGPAVGAAKQAIVGRLEGGAEKGVMQALGPTKERYKAIAERLTPEILKRGLRGSRESLQAKAADTLVDVGQQLDTALQQYGSQQVGTTPIMSALETAKDAFRTTNPAGKVVEFEPRAIKQLSGLQQVITDLGPDATVDQLIAVRRAWDKVVDQAGGFAHRAGGAIGVPLKDQSEAWAKREATGAIRKALETNVPDLAAINKEWSFWKNLDDVLTQTLQRTQPQGPGLLRQGAEAAGQIVGATAGSTAGPAGAVGGAFAVGKLAKFADQVFRSPRWQLASAQAKDALAQAIASGKPATIASALSRITTATPSLAVQGK